MRRFSIAICVLGLTSATLPPARADDKNDPKKLPPALVQLLSGSPENFIKRLDRNKDGYLTKNELPPRLAAAFDKFDANSDDKLDKKEVQEMLVVLRQRFGINTPTPAKPGKANEAKEVERVVDKMLERMDTNKDGLISKGEAQGPLAKGFDLLDTNKDGFLDRAELRLAAERVLEGRGKENAKGQPGLQAKSQPDFDALDSNADGRLTREELKGTPFAEQFDQIDTNKDGQIDRKEFTAYLRKQAEKKEP